MNQYKFLGKLSMKKRLLWNLVGFILSIITISFLFPQNLNLGVSLFIGVYLLIVGEVIWRNKKSVAILTESHCLIVEIRYYGLVKVKKKMDIAENEKESLKEYFRFLTSNTEDIRSFSIASLNKLIEEKIKFKNFNIKSKNPL